MSDEKSKFPVQPLGNRVIVKVHKEEEVTEGGLLRPHQYVKKLNKGTIMALGPCYNEKNEVGWLLKTGDVVYLMEHAGSTIEVEKEEYLVLFSEDILAKE